MKTKLRKKPPAGLRDALQRRWRDEIFPLALLTLGKQPEVPVWHAGEHIPNYEIGQYHKLQSEWWDSLRLWYYHRYLSEFRIESAVMRNHLGLFGNTFNKWCRQEGISDERVQSR